MSNYAMRILDRVNKPEDIKNLTIQELEILCKEIRELIIEVVLRNGGHLASNLGVVELTVALYYIFDFLYDKLIWDVSHQCYTHKILSGRKKDIYTLRKYKGISGFTNKEESPYDIFTVGHAGTSISTALGLDVGYQLIENLLTNSDNINNKSLDQSKSKIINKTSRKRKIISVVGDASIGIGMSFEAINHAGEIDKDFIIILNDNNMSISKTVGSLSKYLNKIRYGKLYNEFKKDILIGLDKIPKKYSDKLKKEIKSIKDHIKSLFIEEQGRLFQDLGLNYFGPINGHNIEVLINVLDKIKEVVGPILLHVVTEKGHGYEKAASNPTFYHGISPDFLKNSYLISTENGNTLENSSCLAIERKGKEETELLNSQINVPVSKKTYTDAFGESVVEIAQTNKDIVVISAAMVDGTGLTQFKNNFPERFFDVGISEQHALGFAAGLYSAGLKPIVAVYSTFLQRAYDQLFQEISLNNSKIIIALDRAGIVGEDGPTHNGVFDISYCRCLPNTILIAPKDAFELKQMLKFSLTLDKPVIIRYPRAIDNSLFDNSNYQPLELGKAETIIPPTNITFLAYGSMVENCFLAANMLKKKGIEVGLINARFCKPLDIDLITELINSKVTIVTVEENVLSGGFGSHILETITTKKLLGKAKLYIKALPDSYIECGDRKTLLKDCNLDPISLSSFIEELLNS